MLKELTIYACFDLAAARLNARICLQLLAIIVHHSPVIPSLAHQR
jgi:hypothetical protein